jgi:hypothetical protein
MELGGEKATRVILGENKKQNYSDGRERSSCEIRNVLDVGRKRSFRHITSSPMPRTLNLGWK